MKNILLSLAALFFISGCHSVQKKIQTPQSVSIPQAPEPVLTSLTTEGENIMGRFSNDGSQIIFIGQNRDSHKNAQVYIMNVKTGRERRITFNAGEDSYPSFDPTGKFILYASTTDELKEHPSPLPPNASFFDPQSLTGPEPSFKEIYTSESDGSHILRLTQSPDFDGTPEFSTDGHHIVFATKRTGELKLFSMEDSGKKQIPLFTGSKESEIEPSFSPSGRHLLWVRKIGDGGSEIIMADNFGRHSTPLTTHDAINRDPDFSPDKKRIVFSSNRENKNNFSLYTADLDGSCATKISPPIKTDEKKSDKNPLNVADVFPHFSPDNKRIIFTSNRSGSYQIYVTDFTPPADCHPAKM